MKIDELFIELNTYEKNTSHAIKREKYEFGSNKIIQEPNIILKKIISYESDIFQKGYIEVEFLEDLENQSSISISIDYDNWNRDNYLMLPAAAYNGNRFDSLDDKYPPILNERYNISPNMPVTITDVPRLSINEEFSEIQLKMGDMSTPCVTFFDKMNNRSFYLLTDYISDFGYNGLTIMESDKGDILKIRINIPSVREEVCYSMCNTKRKSPDIGYSFKKGDKFKLNFELHFKECNSIHEFYKYFFEIRKNMTQDQEYNNIYPFSKSYELINNKYNKENWNKNEGYYTVGTDGGKFNQWQAGWIGGGMVTLPLYKNGNDENKSKVESALDFIFSKTQSKSGFFYGIYRDGKPQGDDFRNPEKENILLIRKNADMLYFLLKLYMEFDERLKKKYEKGLIDCANAFVRLFEKCNQWGLLVDIDEEDVKVGSTACGAAAIASLSLAYEIFNDPKYLQTAEMATKYYYTNFTEKGLTNGGPGEIMQCQDSESCFALLESYVCMYEITGDKLYLDYAQNGAFQASSWCVSYNFKFPKESVFGKLDMKTIGTVYANVQNKHSAPGIATLSGDSLIRLYRYTNNIKYLELARDIIHTLPQYISTVERPILTNKGINLPSGYMNERVNMSDWEGLEMVGGVFYGSCWPEVSLLLATVEVPSVYIVFESNTVCCFDSVKATLNGEKLILYNLTSYDGEFTILVEDSIDRSTDFSEKLKGAKKVFIKANEKIELDKSIFLGVL